MDKAIEAAAEVIWLDMGGRRYGGGHYEPDSQLVTVIAAKATARAAIRAYLSALKEDPEVVERSMKAVLKAWSRAGVSATPQLEASEIAARAALSAIEVE